jgi:hypothetical protein
MCLAVALPVAGAAAKLLLARWISWYCVTENLTYNGPAIWGGCVTRRSIRAESRYFSQKAVTVQGGYGAVFAVRVQILMSIDKWKGSVKM